MNKKYNFVSYYKLLPLFVMPVLVALEYIGIANPQLRYQDIFIAVIFLGLIYLSLKISRNGAPSSVMTNYANNYAQSNSGMFQSSAVSFTSPSQSGIIQLAQATIQLARSVIASYKAR